MSLPKIGGQPSFESSVAVGLHLTTAEPKRVNPAPTQIQILLKVAQSRRTEDSGRRSSSAQPCAIDYLLVTEDPGLRLGNFE